MIRWIVGTSLKLRFIVLVIAAALMVFGMVQLPRTPLDVFPEYFPTTCVVLCAPGTNVIAPPPSLTGPSASIR